MTGERLYFSYPMVGTLIFGMVVIVSTIATFCGYSEWKYGYYVPTLSISEKAYVMQGSQEQGIRFLAFDNTNLSNIQLLILARNYHGSSQYTGIEQWLQVGGIKYARADYYTPCYLKCKP